MAYDVQCVDRRLKVVFYRLGECVAKHTGYFIIVPFFIALLFATGLQNIDYRNDPQFLYTQENGRGFQEKTLVESLFAYNASANFRPDRLSQQDKFGRIIAVAKDGGSILRKHIWEELVLLDEKVLNLTIIDMDIMFDYFDLCALNEGYCFENTVLQLKETIGQVEMNETTMKYPVYVQQETYATYFLPAFIGGAEVDEDGVLLSAKAMNLMYFLDGSSGAAKRRVLAWELKFLELLQDLEFKHINVSMLTSQSSRIEVEENTLSAMPYLAVAGFIMSNFIMMANTRLDSVRSKPGIGQVGITSATLGTVAAFGAITYVGVPFIGMNLAAPFLMLGIGLDDTFVMLAAWHRTRIQDSVAERLGKTYSEAAVSITITSITDMLSFYIGAFNPFPSVHIFCLYTGTAVLFTYLCHITFFGAWLAIAGKWESENRHSVTLRKVKSFSESENEPWWYRVFCAGGISSKDPYNKLDNKEHSITLFFKEKMAPVLHREQAKSVVIFLFLVYLALSAWGITHLQEGVEVKNIVRRDSYMVDFHENLDTYFMDYPFRIQMVLHGDIEYSDLETQEKLDELVNKVQNLTHISSNSRLTEWWMPRFLDYVDRNMEVENLNISTEELFCKTLKENFLSGYSNLYKVDVNFNANASRILATRLVFQAIDFNATADLANLMQELRTIADESEFDVAFFHLLFPFIEQLLVIRQVTIQVIVIAAIVMMIVSLIFIPHPLCCLWVVLSIVSIEIGVIGFMSLWDVNLDTISMTCLIMCIGFSVDFSAHISYAYMSAEAESSQERMREALYHLGLPIVQSAISSILCVCTLIAPPSYLFNTYFKIIFLVMIFGAAHGLLLLPVLLSIFTPEKCRAKQSALKHVTSSTIQQVSWSTLAARDTANQPEMCYKNATTPTTWSSISSRTLSDAENAVESTPIDPIEKTSSLSKSAINVRTIITNIQEKGVEKSSTYPKKLTISTLQNDSTGNLRFYENDGYEDDDETIQPEEDDNVSRKRSVVFTVSRVIGD